MNKTLKVMCFILFALFAGINTIYAQGQSPTGLVVDENGQPMIGVQIKIEGTTVGAITDVDGNFTIKAQKGNILLFSYVGYEQQKITYKGEKVLAIKMLPSTEMLEDVVVIGYGKQKKNSVVSSINAIGPKELSVSSSRNMTNNLAGQVPGLIAVQRSGEPGYDNADFWIRGQSSFKGGTNPLVLVDGVPRQMQDIEADEIESFTLLKDAAATAVYGAEGANGVILITSKRGNSQKPKISFRAEGTILEPTRLPTFMNSVETLNLYNEALNNEGTASIRTDEEIAKYGPGADRDLYPDTDWLGTMLRNHTYNMRYTLNVRGGTERARYFVSGAFYQENGIFKDFGNDYDNNIGLKRYNLRSNIDFDATKTTTVKVDLSGQYLQTNYPGTGTSTIFTTMCRTPSYIMPAVYSDGTVAGHPRPSGNRSNPYNQLVNSGYAKEWRTSIQSKVEVDQKLDFLTKGLTWKGLISFDADMSYIAKRTKTPTQYLATGRDENGKLLYKTVVEGSDVLSENLSNSSNKKIYFETAFNYNRTFAEKHDVGAMFLYMQKETQYHNNALPYRKQGLVGRVTYGYDGRYFLEGNFGYTGSETFAKGYRFGFFPAMGLAWYISNEHYYPEALKKVVSKLKLRFSIGRTGNDDTGGNRFLYRGTMKQDNSGYNIGFSNSGALGGVGNGITEAQFESPFLSWEIEDKRNFGIDLGLFDNRIDLQVDYFNNKRKDILLQRNTVSNVTGFQQMPWQNFGIVKNQGVDASLNLNYKVGEVNLSARGNFTFARNEILEYDQVPQVYPWLEKKGTRLNSWKLYIADGLYTADDFNITGEGLNRQYELKPGVVSGLSSGVRPGDIKYKDLNGDGKIDSNDQMEDVGNPSVPEIVYGFGLNAKWKGAYVGIFFQGSGNTSTVLGASSNGAFFPFQWGVEESAVRSEVANRWTEQNPSQNVMFPRMHSTNYDNNTAASTWWLRNASFLRLKNIEVGYNFKEKTLKKIGIQALRVYLQGNNLCVWDDIKMWDPELGNTNGGFSYPLSRTFTFGLDFTF
ncbi:SusC/RagA family TonB-linked outer membrane protein [Bacteroides thetaiotaomicron]|jgi:TonB-linked SusC/RagA family outer membrane protein|uniref:SusC/RagA family TonB-linked outer membrane protein n=1 Tax=Bacteroides thetaiotaomicron TaxID=818 RepID=UPI001898FF26|nr:TonB-dependent receptor [Bacteroides thetaiotaomicron]MBX9048895.1 TonB-dependent receptor [Bacteroides thetaiotaomicron]MBX9071890.1 TonB-dependent receptor [Bacteroides thetaiotaomicron]MDC2177752.1 TonB-dependent receptor [Bacteroides thetaiotaomicron]MDC2192913.1 TonB-dependent receptor [Bacteroides thetaiotaomicron]MDC2257617.1 TonB-dependent receptor [Bacteroides thetaiotaomicron]